MGCSVMLVIHTGVKMCVCGGGIVLFLENLSPAQLYVSVFFGKLFEGKQVAAAPLPAGPHLWGQRKEQV